MSKVESISREDLGWLAGFVDGEGCFYLGFNVQTDREIPRKTLRTSISIGSTTIECLVKASTLLKALQVGFIVSIKKEPTNPKWNRAMSIVVCGHGRTEKLSKILLPYLTCKKEQAIQIINACEYRKALAFMNGGNNKNSLLIKEPILTAMCDRMKELNAYRIDMTRYSRQAGEIIRDQKPSTTTRLEAIRADFCPIGL